MIRVFHLKSGLHQSFLNQHHLNTAKTLGTMGIWMLQSLNLRAESTLLSTCGSRCALYPLLAIAMCTILHWSVAVNFLISSLYKDQEQTFGEAAGLKNSVDFNSFIPTKEFSFRTLTQIFSNPDEGLWRPAFPPSCYSPTVKVMDSEGTSTPSVLTPLSPIVAQFLLSYKSFLWSSIDL